MMLVVWLQSLKSQSKNTWRLRLRHETHETHETGDTRHRMEMG